MKVCEKCGLDYNETDQEIVCGCGVRENCWVSVWKPKSFRAGQQVGFMAGLAVGITLGVAFAAGLLGFLA